MANFFDQYGDTGAAKSPTPDVAQGAGNFFDQYDQTASPPGIGTRLGKDAAARQDAVKGMEANSPLLAGSKAVGQAAGFLAKDVPGEAMKSVFDSLPTGVQDHIKNAGSWAVNTDLGKLGVNALKAGGDAWNSFQKVHPDMASVVEDAANAGNFLAMVPAAGAAAPVISDTASAMSKTAGDAAASTVKAIAPQVDAGLKDTAVLARKYSIPLSIDQITSSKAVKNAQKVSQELPFSGQSGFREQQLSAWNKQVLKTVGVDGDKFTKATMNKAFTDVGSEFDNFGKGQTFNLDHGFNQDIANIQNDSTMTATKDARDNFDAVLQTIKGTADADGNISGEQLNLLRSRVNALARKANNPDTQDLLHDLENAIVDTITTDDPKQASALSAAKQKYKNLIAIEPLAAKAKAGNISPALLNDRVFRIYGRSHVVGNAGEIGDLAQIGHELLPELGGSDTVQKAIYATGAMGGIAAQPAATATVIGGNRLLQSGVNRNQGLVDRLLK